MSPVLVLRGVAKTYVAGHGPCRAAVRALDSVDLEVCAGELIEVVGARGAGKSTLLLCAAGLLRPDRGCIAWPAAPAPPTRASREGARDYLTYVAAGMDWHAAPRSERTRLVLLDGCVEPFEGRGALDAWLAALAERSVAVLVATRVPALVRARRVVVMERGRVARDVYVDRGSAIARVAERDLALAHGSIDRDSGPA